MNLALTSVSAALFFVFSMIAGVTPSNALEKGDWLLRVRAISISPTDESGGISPDLLTAGLDPQSAIVPELDITYMLTDTIGLELIAATSVHQFEGTGAIAGLGDVAEAWLLPPTLLAQYHFRTNSKFRPYIGAGINYTISYLENAHQSLEAVLGPTTVKADNSFGWALQAGMDYDISDKWFMNIDVKYIDLGVDIQLNSRGVIRNVAVDINPVVFGIGFGYRF
ncbi:MAG: OmpW family protein [Alphaproteobacteria bacterium]|nr:OmpW family protein [Alphaproteobacteria bacterium]